MKAIFSGVAVDRRDDQVALVLAPVIVHHNDNLAAFEGAKRLDDFRLFVNHGIPQIRPVWPLCRR